MGPQQRKVLLFKDLGEEALTEESAKSRPRQEGCRGVVKVPSLLFDIELEDSAAEESKGDDDVQDALRQLKALVRPWSTTELQLQQQVRRASTEAAADGIKLDAHQLAERLDLPGYTVKVRTALGGGWSGDCLRQLRHFFLTCIAPGGAGGVSYVIDPCFREQFEIANATAQYSSILAELPREFIGTEDRIASIVTILSAEIKRSFQATGATLPPWRQPASMLSKWRPRRSEDITVAPARAGPSFRAVHPVGFEATADTLPATPGCGSSSSDGVAATIAETGGSRKLGVTGGALRQQQQQQQPSCSPPFDSGLFYPGSKRSRAGANYSSMLASKLRGVSALPSRPTGSDAGRAQA